MQSDGTQQSLEEVLAREVECTERLLGCLEAERSALTRRDLPALEKTTEQKIEYTGSLEQLDQRRQQLLSELGFAADSEGVQQCLAGLPGAERLQRLWQQVLTNVEACQNGNLANGGILESGRQHVEQALRILRGQTAAPSHYDPNGDTAADLGQRDLGKV